MGLHLFVKDRGVGRNQESATIDKRDENRIKIMWECGETTNAQYSYSKTREPIDAKYPTVNNNINFFSDCLILHENTCQKNVSQ